MMKLKGRGILITGANQGLGKAIAAACIREGAHVMLCARNASLLEEARADLAGRAAPGQRVAALPADVSSGADVRAAVARFRALGAIHGVVNNAGIQGPMGLLEDNDFDEWAETVRVNLFGTALVCRELLPVFRAQRYGKIVNLSGGGAAAPRPRLSAYAASKAAVVRLTETLAEETAGEGIDVNAIAPGALNTRLLDELLAAGPEKIGAAGYAGAVRQKEQGGASLERGADLTVFLLSAESDGITGRLISAVWDPWEKLASKREALRGSDIYTLRRIVPKERGEDWT